MLIDFDLGGRVEVSHLFVRLISELKLLSAVFSLPSCVGSEGVPERKSRCVDGFYSCESD